MLVVKSLHILFVTSWFAGLFYLPRIFVNLAMDDNPAVRERLLVMARKLYRFMTILMIPALAFGLWLWLGYGISGGWMHAKLALVVVLIGYHHMCKALLKRFEAGTNTVPCRAPCAFRMRVSISPSESLIAMSGLSLPTRLDHAGDLPGERKLP